MIDKSMDSVTIRALGAGDTGNELRCNGYMVKGYDNFNQLLDVHDRYSAMHPGHHLIMTLDNRDQLEYTTFHASMKYELDDPESLGCEENDGLPVLNFNVRLERFKHAASLVNFNDACERGIELSEDDLESLIAINEEPLPYIDEEVAFYVVPVNSPELTLSIMPVGYFSVDLSPFENAALVKKMHVEYGYRFIGVGACLLAFKKDRDLSTDHVNALINDLDQLYHCDGDPIFEEGMRSMLLNQEYLLLLYSDAIT